MKKILVVFGTRPEAIKMAPLVIKLRESGMFYAKVCVTAQHRHMLDQVLKIFEIEPDYDLDLMKPGQDLFDVTSNVLLKIKQVLFDFTPDLVFVHGDTTTSFSAALACYYKQIPVAHIEAGLRTYNIYSPWPEELYRQLTARIVKYHFAPTLIAKNNLIQEAVNATNIVITGNTVIDALHIVKERLSADYSVVTKISEEIRKAGYQITERRIILVTGHRRENFGQGFQNICEALKTIAYENNDVDIVYPLHLNPNVKGPVQQILSGINNMYLIEPLDYEPFVYLMSQSYIVLTDSGGVQEEAPGFGKPVLVMRDNTERPEALKAGTVKLVGTNKKRIIKEISSLLHNIKDYNKMAIAHNPYGDGKACDRIIKYLIDVLT